MLRPPLGEEVLLTPERWLHVKEITADALERPETERSSFVATACAGDGALLAEVESLVGADGRARDFLNAPGLAEAGAAEAVARAAEKGMATLSAGRRMGPYRILDELGHGGMGIVYLAERADAAYEKQVAIKVVRAAAFAGEALMRRFHEERRILATLEHPNIARLLDAGTTEDGLPYFVMEHVDGIPLDDYCRNLPTLEARLVLFQQVCAAVQYAHQRLVIHRDLKAGNILVAADGTPKLLDFGIARLLEPGLEPEEQTRTGLRAFTLEAASPEQVRGELLTVTSDVYALGVLLYRLLTGQGPYGSSRRSDTDLIRAISEDTPERPSAVAPGERPPLRGELDWITLKALRKEADRRYASVQQLGDDVRRYIEGRPVVAGPDSWSYRTRKFVTRNRTPVAIGALLVVSMIGGVTATLSQARRADAQRARAERGFADVRKLANSFLFEHDDAIKNLPGSTPARELLVRRALQYLDGLSREASHDRSLRRELAAAYQKVGDVQSNPFGANLGDSAGARASYGKALAILAGLAADDPADLRIQRNLAHCYTAIGDLEWTAGDGHDSAVRNYREALAIREAISVADPASVESRLYLAESHRALANMTGEMKNHLRAAELSAVLFAERPASREIRILLSASHESLGSALASAGEWARALELQEKALQIRRALLAEEATNVSLLRRVAASCFQLGAVREVMGDTAGAVESYREMLAIYQKLTAADPTDAQARGALATAHTNVGRVLATRADSAGALASLRAALAIGEQLHAADTKNTQVHYLLAVSLHELGKVSATLAVQPGAPVAAQVRHWRQARALFQRSHDALSGLKARVPSFIPDERDAVDDIPSEIERCDRAVEELRREQMKAVRSPSRRATTRHQP